MQHSALVVIDLQNDITKNYKEIIEKVNTAIDWAVKKEPVGHLHSAQQFVCGNKDFQARNPWRRACAGDECRIRAYLYKDEK